jgi:hypothetical protein
MPHLPIFIKFKGLFIHTNLSDNNLRHFGFKSHKILFLQIQELLYLNSKDLQLNYSVEIRAYFELKNNGYNVLPTKLDFNYNDYNDFNLLFNILDFKDLNCSKVLKKFTKEEILEIKKMEKKINECIKDENLDTKEGINMNECINETSINENTNNIFLIYRKTKNFKRSDEPLGKLIFINKFEKVRDVLKTNLDFKMICLLSEDDFIFLDVQKIENLSFSLDPRLRKKGKGVGKS